MYNAHYVDHSGNSTNNWVDITATASFYQLLVLFLKKLFYKVLVSLTIGCGHETVF